MSMCRQIHGCENNVSETIVGTKGLAQRRLPLHAAPTKSRVRIEHEVNPYVQEHIDLLESILAQAGLNELKQVAESTLTAIMGRMSAYTGKAVTWEKALELEARHLPQEPAMGALADPAGRHARAYRADLIRSRVTIGRTVRPLASRGRGEAARPRRPPRSSSRGVLHSLSPLERSRLFEGDLLDA